MPPRDEGVDHGQRPRRTQTRRVVVGPRPGRHHDRRGSPSDRPRREVWALPGLCLGLVRWRGPARAVGAVAGPAGLRPSSGPRLGRVSTLPLRVPTLTLSPGDERGDLASSGRRGWACGPRYTRSTCTPVRSGHGQLHPAAGRPHDLSPEELQDASSPPSVVGGVASTRGHLELVVDVVSMKTYSTRRAEEHIPLVDVACSSFSSARYVRSIPPVRTSSLGAPKAPPCRLTC